MGPWLLEDDVPLNYVRLRVSRYLPLGMYLCTKVERAGTLYEPASIWSIDVSSNRS